MTEDERMIAAARRKARRMARGVADLTYHQALNAVARQSGRGNWTGFLAAPAAIARDPRPGDCDSGITYDVPVADAAFMRSERVAIFGMTATTLYLGSHGDHARVRRHFAEERPALRLDFLDTVPEMINRYLERLDSRSGAPS